MIYPCKYKIEFFNEDTHKIIPLEGITFGSSYADCMEKIEKYYGDDLCSAWIELQEEGEVYEFDEEP